LDLIGLNANALEREASLDLVPGRLGSRVVQRNSGTFDLYLSAPDDAVLFLELNPELERSQFSIEVETEDTARVLEFLGDDASPGRAEIGAGGSMRLRFENRSGAELSWSNLIIRGCASAAPPAIDVSPRPLDAPVNVLLYVVDTLRHDHLSAYGYERQITPNLDRLARRGFLFDNTYAPGTATLPSVSALFTSRHPSLSRRALREKKTTLAGAFQRAGYNTVAFQANYLANASLGLASGFDKYWSLRGPQERPFLRAGDLHRRALNWLRSRPPGPFFVYIQSMDVHEYDPPPAFEKMQWKHPSEQARLSQSGRKMSTDNYDRTIAYMDSEIGKLFDGLRALNLEGETVVLITSDHGEPLSQHGHVLHGTSVYEELVHIPAILVLPWHEGGVRVEPIVSLIDLAPTLLELAGLPVPDDFQGHSLLQSYPAGEAPTAVGEKTKWLLRDRKHGEDEWYLRRGPWKLIMDEVRVRLFHLPTDRGETRDLSAERPIVAAHLATELMARTPIFRSGWAEVPPLDSDLSAQEGEELEKALRSLGYAD
jgi:arylsulfatase A-like enzyme